MRRKPLCLPAVTLWQLNGLGLGLGAGNAASQSAEEGMEWFKVCPPRIASAPHHLWAIKHQLCKQLSSEQWVSSPSLALDPGPQPFCFGLRSACILLFNF